jgi:hypothetical protein
MSGGQDLVRERIHIKRPISNLDRKVLGGLSLRYSHTVTDKKKNIFWCSTYTQGRE